MYVLQVDKTILSVMYEIAFWVYKMAIYTKVAYVVNRIVHSYATIVCQP